MPQDTLEIDSISALFTEGTYFDKVSAFHTAGHALPGVEGEIIPYSLQDDVWVLGTLVLSFLLMSFVFSKSYQLIFKQLKEFLVERSRGNLFEETGTEFHYPVFLVTNAAVLFGLIVFALFFRPQGTLMLIPPKILLGWCIGASLLVYLGRFLVYSFVNWIFFDKAKRERWMEILSLVTSLQGVLYFLFACLLIYFNLPMNLGIIVLVGLLIIVKLILFCKSFSIFFANLQGFLTNILYFCTLEMIPLLLLLKIITEINQSWTINF